MRIALGQDVFAHDGKRVGTVDRLVLNAETHQVEAIVVHKGVILSSDKLIDRALIERSDETGVHLSIDATEEKTLPNYYHGQYYEWSPDSRAVFSDPLPGWYAGTLLYVNPPASGRGYPGTDSFFEVAPANPPDVKPERNLVDADVLIGPGAEVIDVDGRQLGHVHDVILDEIGGLSGIVVRTGVIHKRDLQIPAAWIAEADDDRVRLNVRAEKAEKSTTANAATRSRRSRQA